MANRAGELVREFRKLGVELFVGDDGVVHGRMTNDEKMPHAAWLLVDELRMMNEAVDQYLKNEKVVRLEGVTVQEAVEYAMHLKNGFIQLVGKVVFHKKTGLCDLTFQGEIPDGE